MEETKQKKCAPKLWRILRAVLIVLLCIIVLAVGALWFMFRKELSTLSSLSRVEEDVAFFTMEYKGDYGLDEFLEAGAANDGELIEFIMQRLLKGLPITLDIPTLGCSTFTAVTPEGERVFGRNFDLSPDCPAVLVWTDPAAGYSSVSMVNLGFLGYNYEKLPENLLSSIVTLAAPYAPLDGVNEAGLAIGVLAIKGETNQSTGKTDITTTTAIRMILDYCATVDEAVEMLGQYDMHSSAGSSYHFQIADLSGHSVVVEYIDNEMVVLDGADYATNFLLYTTDWERGPDCWRYEILTEGLDEAGRVLSMEDGMALLAAVEQDGSSASGSRTRWSAMYNMDTGEVEVCMLGDYEKVYNFALG